MGKPSAPRHGSMQFWPRTRAKRTFARIRSHNEAAVEKGLVGFAGYKAGMSHMSIIDNRKNAQTKGEEITIPVTLIEVPDLTVYGMRSYGPDEEGNIRAISEQVVKASKPLLRRGPFAKKESEALKTEGATFIHLLVSTHPEQTGLSKKSAELFEMAIGGSFDEQLSYAKEMLGKSIPVKDVFKELDIVDAHAVSKGKGFQGPVKRFGVTLRSHKSEKVKRGPASLGAFTAARTYRVAHAGQMGYHQRMDYNKQILAILDPKDIQIAGGIIRYGQPTSTVLVLKGSIPGPKKRLIRFTPHLRPCADKFEQMPEVVEISKKSHQY